MTRRVKSGTEPVFPLALALLVALVGSAPAAAGRPEPTPGWPTCIPAKPPTRTGLTETKRERAGDLLTITARSRAMGRAQTFRVLLPRGYDPKAKTRYPVLYALHGAGGDYRSWLDGYDMAKLFGSTKVIVVTPNGSDADANGTYRNGAYIDWYGLAPGETGPAFQWESFHVRELVPLIDEEFATIPDASGRAVVGISMGGGGLRYAAKFPGLFGYAASFSGAIAPNAGRDCQLGDPSTQAVRWRDESALDLAENLRGVRLFLRTGTGARGPLDPVTYTDPVQEAVWRQRYRTETLANGVMRLFLDRLRDVGLRRGVDSEFYPGSHYEAYWSREMPEFVAWLRRELKRPVKAPATFSVDSSRPEFTAWGWKFEAKRKVREFAYVDVTRGKTVTATGSGKLVVTPPKGRRFTIDLGPSHTEQQWEFPDELGPGRHTVKGWRTRTASVAKAAPPRANAAAATPKPPPRESITRTIVPLPAGITRVEFPVYTSDGERLIANAASAAFAGSQLVTVAEGGSDFRCLTCASYAGPPLRKPVPFPDGKRVLVRVGNQSPTQAADHAVVECEPSVRDCRTATVVPIEPPAGEDPAVVQDQREYRVAPDGRTVALSQVRTTRSGRQDGVGIVGRLRRATGSYVVDDPRVVAHGGELKGFTPDGREIMFARFEGAFEAANPDDVAVDLRTGKERRLTNGPDWEEDIDIGSQEYRGRSWMVVGSARSSELLEPVSQLRRPNAIDLGLSSLPYVLFGTRQDEIAEPWLVDEYDTRGSYIGQPLAPGAVRSGWDSRANFRWRPDGAAVVFWQERTNASKATRVVVAHLDDRRASEAARAPADSPSPRWAPSLSGYVPPDGKRPRSRRGKASGRMTVRVSKSPRRGYDERIVVSYDNFAETGGSVIDGAEISDYDIPRGPYGAPSFYNADLTLSGRFPGYLRARNVAIGDEAIKGVIRSRVGGRRLTLGPIP